jgi:hypothetical protein
MAVTRLASGLEGVGVDHENAVYCCGFCSHISSSEQGHESRSDEKTALLHDKGIVETHSVFER